MNCTIQKKIISTLSLNKHCSVKTALSSHNENKTQFLISIGCKWSFAKPVHYLHGLPLNSAIVRLAKLVNVNVCCSTQSLCIWRVCLEPRRAVLHRCLCQSRRPAH